MKNVFIHAAGIGGVKRVAIEGTDSVATLIEKARALGFPGDGDAQAYLEDDEAPLDWGVAIADLEIPENASVHVSVCPRVNVKVRYAGDTEDRDFAPAQRVRHVFNWAISDRAFDIAKQDAQDLALRQCGQQGAANSDDHVGSFLSGDDCSVCFDLLPIKRIQG